MDKYVGTNVQSMFVAEGVVFQKLLLVCWRNEAMGQCGGPSHKEWSIHKKSSARCCIMT